MGPRVPWSGGVVSAQGPLRHQSVAGEGCATGLPSRGPTTPSKPGDWMGVVFAGRGDDEVKGGDRAYGGRGHDDLEGSQLFGGPGADFLVAAGPFAVRAFVMRGGPGGDEFSVPAGFTVARGPTSSMSPRRWATCSSAAPAAIPSFSGGIERRTSSVLGAAARTGSLATSRLTGSMSCWSTAPTALALGAEPDACCFRDGPAAYGPRAAPVAPAAAR
jgi:hypothetical protein